MRIHITSQITEVPYERTAWVLTCFSGEPLHSQYLPPAALEWVERLRRQGYVSDKKETCVLLPLPEAPVAYALCCMVGERDRVTLEDFRRSGGTAGATLYDKGISHLVLETNHLPHEWPAAFLEGLVLGQYSFEPYRTQEASNNPRGVSEVLLLTREGAASTELETACREVITVATATNAARTLANTPPNDMTPLALALFAQGLAQQYGLKQEILGPAELKEKGLNALCAVGQGSASPYFLIILEYAHPEAKETVALVGKGVTFDTGGISLKPAEQMHEMKFDMCGAAAVLGAMIAVAELQPPIRVIGVIPTVENKPGHNAYVPGDILRAYNGKTIEVLNTDAEGRLILADALAYTEKQYTPDVIVDLATLTGACIAALGHFAAGVMGNSAALVESLIQAGNRTGERLWALPLFEDYKNLIKSEHADMSNIGPKGEAGAIVGGIFLQEFVQNTPWAHVDIAGTAWGVKHIPYWKPEHATGFGVRLLTAWLRQRTHDLRS